MRMSRARAHVTGGRGYPEGVGLPGRGYQAGEGLSGRGGATREGGAIRGWEGQGRRVHHGCVLPAGLGFGDLNPVWWSLFVFRVCCPLKSTLSGP